MSDFDATGRITIPDSAWRETGEHLEDQTGKKLSWARLLCTIDLTTDASKTRLYVEAYAVEERMVDGKCEQHVLDDEVDNHLSGIVGSDAWPLATTTIRGREYIVIATPSGD